MINQSNTLLGVNTYGLCKELTEDFAGTFSRLYEIGFQAIEALVVPEEKQGDRPMNWWALETLMRAKQRVDELGMEIPSLHIFAGHGEEIMPMQELQEYILKVHEMTGVKVFVISGMFSTIKGAEKWGEVFRKTLDILRPYGCQVIYHNHDQELVDVEINGQKKMLLDYFFELVGLDMLLQLDIGWARYAGDEMELARKYANRILEIHCKDFYAEGVEKKYAEFGTPAHVFAPIGEGVVKTKEVLAMREKFPKYNGAIIIDQDLSGGDMMNDLAIGFKNLMDISI